MKKSTCIEGAATHFNISDGRTHGCAAPLPPGGGAIHLAGADLAAQCLGLLSSRCFQRYSAILCSMVAGIIASVGAHAAAAEADYNAPWPDAAKKGISPKSTDEYAAPQSPATATAPVVSAVASPAAPAITPVTPGPGAQDATTAIGQMVDTKPTILAPKPRKNEVAVSGDFFFASGELSVPFGFSVAKRFSATPQTALGVVRTAVYEGATISFSYGQAWYLDLSYLQGQQTLPTVVSVPFVYNGGGLSSIRVSVNDNDNWYQAYLRYTFPRFLGKPFSAYLRGGFSLVEAQLTASDLQGIGYHQVDKTTDILGNLGLGAAYRVYNGRRFRTWLQVEAEGFGGTRSQKSVETIVGVSGTPETADINNTIYGGIGRGTLHLEYRLGHSGVGKVFAEAGLQARFSQIIYPAVNNLKNTSLSEYLWGPYINLGLRYAF